MAVRCWMCLWGHWPCPTGTIVFVFAGFFGGWFLRHRNILRSRCVPQVFLADVGILRFWQSFCRSPHLEAEQTRQAVVAQATAGYGALIWATESQIFGTSAGNVNPVSPTPYDPDICYFSPFGTESWKKHKKAGRIMSAQRQPFWFCCLLLLKLCSIQYSRIQGDGAHDSPSAFFHENNAATIRYSLQSVCISRMHWSLILCTATIQDSYRPLQLAPRKKKANGRRDSCWGVWDAGAKELRLDQRWDI